MFACPVQISALKSFAHKEQKKKDIKGSTYIYINAYKYTYVFSCYHYKKSIRLRQTWRGSRITGRSWRMSESGKK